MIVLSGVEVLFVLGRYNSGYVPPHMRNQGMGRGGPPVPMQGMPPSYGGGPMTGPNGGKFVKLVSNF